MSCRNSCKLCNRIVISDSVTFEAGTGLLIDLPSRAYNNCEKYCIVVAQTIPEDTTITAPVFITIGGDTAIRYPLTMRDCSQVTACGIKTRTRYCTRVSTSPTGGTFRLMNDVCCYPSNDLASLPAPTPAPAPNA